MPNQGIIVTAALGAILWVYVVHPLVKPVRKMDQAICHAVTLHKKCGAKPKN